MTFDVSYREIFNTVILDIEKVNCGLEDLIPVKNAVYEELQEFLVSPSKRIRSVMVFLYLRACGIDITHDFVELMVVVELIHNASLIHDDVIDDDEKRRGNNSVNYDFGNRIAILSGDFLLSIVMKKLAALKYFELFNIFAKTLERMCDGEIKQHLSLNKISTLEAYLEKSYLKTGSLFEAALSAAMVIAGKHEYSNEISFASNFGIAFQIRDDLANALQAESKDLLGGVYTAPVIFSGSTQINSEGIEKTKDLLNNYLVKAEECIADLAENKYKSALVELLELLKND